MIANDLMLAATLLVALMIVSGAALKGWHEWIALKTRELDRFHDRNADPRPGSPEGAARIEIADLKERIRKLEAIASGVDL